VGLKGREQKRVWTPVSVLFLSHEGIGGFMRRQSKNEDSDTRTSRRSFLGRIWMGLGFIAIAEFIFVVFAFLRPGKPGSQKAAPDTIITVGSVDDFRPKSVTAFVRGRFYLSRLEDGGFIALSRKCTHLGCTVPWVEKEEQFACPCHRSAYDITGNVIASPAPRPLDFYPLTIENRMIKVDTKQALKRDAFRTEQVTYVMGRKPQKG
jgi:cytochrome b6-f complex iron-sulfur subunit